MLNVNAASCTIDRCFDSNDLNEAVFTSIDLMRSSGEGPFAALSDKFRSAEARPHSWRSL